MEKRRCKKCNSPMIVKVLHEESQNNSFMMDGEMLNSVYRKYFWFCSQHLRLCNNVESTKLIIRQNDSRKTYSMSAINHTDQIADQDRHVAVGEIAHTQILKLSLGGEYKFKKINHLDLLLGFNNLREMFIWFTVQKIFIDDYAYNWGDIHPNNSNYTSFLFKRMIDYINSTYGNIINQVKKDEESLIQMSITSSVGFGALIDTYAKERKMDYVYGIRKAKEEEKKRLSTQKRISDKASIDMFNAIRRNDEKAILALRIKGADLTVTNRDGITPLKYAQALKKNNIVIEALTSNMPQNE